jgi:hypothetical protein
LGTPIPSWPWSAPLSLALAWHLGRRTAEDASRFAAKLSGATAGRFQLSTDGFNAYPAATEEHLGGRVDYAQYVKVRERLLR